ncbi:unnamed protein product [Linum tenue]|uniref:Storage protein n=1 Tax=Linum tenue TaxID=586396 RepID=A0AAV0IKA1_9ROSI|nr:unnamed protein product [Linum tenue]
MSWFTWHNLTQTDHYVFLFCSLPQIYVPTNPRGAESLPPGIVEAETDLYLRRLWGEPSEDLKKKPKYLVSFTVGWNQRHNIDAAVRKFSDEFTIVLFHYDGRATEWDVFEWSKTAIHISVKRQTKWWYAKRFLHPDVIASYEYIFIWDEDLGVEHFNADKYIHLVKKHGLEISQPGLEPNNGLTWQMTKRRGDREVHKDTEEKPGWCSDPHLPPCAAFVEIMAPVFSRKAWRCVWHMIQNDLVHGWGLDFALRRCVEVGIFYLFVFCSQSFPLILMFVDPTLGSSAYGMMDSRSKYYLCSDILHPICSIISLMLEKIKDMLLSFKPIYNPGAGQLLPHFSVIAFTYAHK